MNVPGNEKHKSTCSMLGSPGKRILMPVVYMGCDPGNGVYPLIPSCHLVMDVCGGRTTYTSGLSQEQAKHDPVAREHPRNSCKYCQHVCEG